MNKKAVVFNYILLGFNLIQFIFFIMADIIFIIEGYIFPIIFFIILSILIGYILYHYHQCLCFLRNKIFSEKKLKVMHLVNNVLNCISAIMFISFGSIFIYTIFLFEKFDPIQLIFLGVCLLFVLVFVFTFTIDKNIDNNIFNEDHK